jgi:hypothetical protein
MGYRAGFIVSSVTAAVMMGSSAAAQRRPEYRVGLLAGANFARLSGTDVVNAGTRTALVAGVFGRADFASSFGLELQALFSDQGTKGDVAPGVSGAVKLSYLKVPLLLAYSVKTPNAQVRPRFFAGPAVSVKLRCKLAARVLGFGTSVDCVDAELPIKSTDASLIGGIGVDIGPVTLAARYDYGLTKIDDSGLGIDIKNRVFAITVAYGFGSR